MASKTTGFFLLAALLCPSLDNYLSPSDSVDVSVIVHNTNFLHNYCLCIDEELVGVVASTCDSDLGLLSPVKDLPGGTSLLTLNKASHFASMLPLTSARSLSKEYCFFNRLFIIVYCIFCVKLT